jgi:uncharacterized membrane protein YuzA (DUF378 family)
VITTCSRLVTTTGNKQCFPYTSVLYTIIALTLLYHGVFSTDSVGVSWTFFVYGILGIVAIIFIYKFVPETKNRSLEEINALFSTRLVAIFK